MRTLLLAAAAASIALPLAPAQAGHRDGRGFEGRVAASSGEAFRCDSRDRRGRDDRRRGGSSCDVFVPGWYGGEWSLYNNRSFEPDSFNGWWHDRPDRAYPRWVQDARNNGTCDPDRMWWSGSGWHC
jgi:hypothetical protein